VPNSGTVGLRPVLGKVYHEAVGPSRPGETKQSRVYQQRHNPNLVPLKQAAWHATANREKWTPSGCFSSMRVAALEEFGKAASSVVGKVPLQFPEEPCRRVLTAAWCCSTRRSSSQSVPTTCDASRLYHTWFGSAGSDGMASPGDASILHARALRKLMHLLLDWAETRAPSEIRPHCKMLGR